MNTPQNREDLSDYQTVQNIALRVLRDIRPFIREGVTEREIADRATQLLAEQGVTQTWYHQVPALVLVGERTIVSLFGKEYAPTPTPVRLMDLVTIDLSPLLRGCWGDCARSYIVAEGRVVSWEAALHIPGAEALCEGIEVEKRLHAFLQHIARPEATMHHLHASINREIRRLGYKNLDFKGNLGHSIEKHLDHRRYMEEGNDTPLGECRYFTFEPHIRKPSSSELWGFKRENIYYFEDSRLMALGSEELLGLL